MTIKKNAVVTGAQLKMSRAMEIKVNRTKHTRSHIFYEFPFAVQRNVVCGGGGGGADRDFDRDGFFLPFHLRVHLI